MKKITRILAVLLSALLFAVGTMNTVLALSMADAKDPIDTTKQCSLTLTCSFDGKKLEGLKIEVFRVATVTDGYHYSLTDAFSDYSIEINDIRAQSEWDEVKDTVDAYIAADKIVPTNTQVTDKNGVVKFESLPMGTYYVRCTGKGTVDQVQGFPPFMIAVPNLNDDGKWIYDVNALPKSISMMAKHDTDEMKLVKLWKDGSQSEKRPEKIAVDILKDGQLCESIELTAADNWTYTWETEGVCTWTAVERNIPEGYTVSIQNEDGNTIQITNTLVCNKTALPQTGDSSRIDFWIMLMALSGIALIILGRHRRKV